MSCGVGWPVAVAPVRLLAWEPPYASGTALKKTPPPKKKKNQIRSVIFLLEITFQKSGSFV